MHIESFEDSPRHLVFLVVDGTRAASIIVEKATNALVTAEAVGSPDTAGDLSFAHEASAWLCARIRPKRLGRTATAA